MDYSITGKIRSTENCQIIIGIEYNMTDNIGIVDLGQWMAIRLRNMSDQKTVCISTGNDAIAGQKCTDQNGWMYPMIIQGNKIIDLRIWLCQKLKNKPKGQEVIFKITYTE